MDYAELRTYIVRKIGETVDARMEIATDYEQKEKFHELSGQIAAYMDVWKYAEALEASDREVRE